ncbi:uncharacterized protein PgNI_00066 [Pyricularia grisea]|uniref:Uncharacterized protein n=1 Tax=Pyricularia grisea TaxID=148305 RepID=A0A6P8BKM7_PYRGI|nr:uncharacterized protein PgNI_00066 [Pyricularia grisea]TLD17249.1 hypothetical protein PgNI_00066 [Pyricularia grisea]
MAYFDTNAVLLGTSFSGTGSAVSELSETGTRLSALTAALVGGSDAGFLGGSLTARQANASRGIMVKATARMVQPKPRAELLSRRCSIMGHTMPPMEEPPMVRPMARPRRCGMWRSTTPSGGQKTSDALAPRSRAWASMSCQYCVHSEVINRASSRPALPAHRGSVGPTRSTSRPPKGEME